MIANTEDKMVCLLVPKTFASTIVIAPPVALAINVLQQWMKSHCGKCCKYGARPLEEKTVPWDAVMIWIDLIVHNRKRDISSITLVFLLRTNLRPHTPNGCNLHKPSAACLYHAC